MFTSASAMLVHSTPSTLPPYTSVAGAYEYRPVIADPHCPCCGAERAMCGDHKPILAERFKTKMCRNYERTGACPYVHRCMFAHGDHELRTPEMNLADGLVTEEAIKVFKRVNYEARCAAEYAASIANFELMSAHSYTPPLTPVAAPTVASSRSSTGSETPVHAPRRPSYRHDPYAERSWWHPLLGMSTSMSDVPTV